MIEWGGEGRSWRRRAPGGLPPPAPGISALPLLLLVGGGRVVAAPRELSHCLLPLLGGVRVPPEPPSRRGRRRCGVRGPPEAAIGGWGWASAGAQHAGGAALRRRRLGQWELGGDFFHQGRDAVQALLPEHGAQDGEVQAEEREVGEEAIAPRGHDEVPPRRAPRRRARAARHQPRHLVQHLLDHRAAREEGRPVGPGEDEHVALLPAQGVLPEGHLQALAEGRRLPDQGDWDARGEAEGADVRGGQSPGAREEDLGRKRGLIRLPVVLVASALQPAPPISRPARRGPVPPLRRRWRAVAPPEAGLQDALHDGLRIHVGQADDQELLHQPAPRPGLSHRPGSGRPPALLGGGRRADSGRRGLPLPFPRLSDERLGVEPPWRRVGRRPDAR